MSTFPLIEGRVAQGFEPVAMEFNRNFRERNELGAAFAVYYHGNLVVDVWGGAAEPEGRRPWRENTMQLIFSGTKALVAVCLLLLIDRDLLDLETPVAQYWPEFGEAGKHKVTVADLVSHRARLPGMRTPLQEIDLTDGPRLARLLAAQPQEHDPRASHVYHALTFGWLCGELCRRLTGLSLGAYFHNEVAVPLDLDLWIGLPPSLEPRVATLTFSPEWGAGAASTDLDEDRNLDDALWASIYANPPLLASKRLPWNQTEFRRAEIPGANGIGTARSIARLFACLANGGELDGRRLMKPETITLARSELSRFVDPFTLDSLRFGVGFELQTTTNRFGPPMDAFGHTGAGGSVHAAWPSLGVGFSYAMNELRDEPLPDARSRGLLHALREVVEPS